MAKKTTNNDALLANIIKGIEEVKGNDIDILDLREIDNSACDYFIICNGNSNTHKNHCQAVGRNKPIDSSPG